MVEYTSELDIIFGSLADETRRDILRRLLVTEMTVGEIASEYEISLAAVSKHVSVLEHAGLVIKQKKGKERIISLVPHGLYEAWQFIDAFDAPLVDRFREIED